MTSLDLERRVRLLFFTDSLVAGGAQRQAVETALQFARSGCDVHLAIYHDIRELGDELEEAGVTVTFVAKNAKFDIGFLLRLYRYFRRIQPDVVHCFLFTPNMWGRIVGRAARIHTVITSERNIDLPQSRLRVGLERVLYRLSDRIIVNAEAIRRVLVDIVGVPEQNIRVIYNCVDVDRFAVPPMKRVSDLRRALALDVDKFVVTLPGRVMRQKNHACLIRAVAMLNISVRRRVQLVFVGNLLDDGYRAGLDKLATELGVDSLIVYAGRQEDMACVYAISDLVALPSLWEGFPNVLLEAMAAGRLVLASAIADNAKLIRHGQNGFLFPSDDAEALARLIGKIIELSDAARMELVTAAKSTVSEQFAPAKLMQSTADVYKEVLPSEIGTRLC